MSDFEIKEKKADVDPCYGLETLEISRADIDALLNGKKLYTTINDYEYAVVIMLED